MKLLWQIVKGFNVTWYLDDWESSALYCIWWSCSHAPSFPKSPSCNPQPEKLKRSWFHSLLIEYQYSGSLSVRMCTHLCCSHMCLCVSEYVLVRGQRQHYTCSTGARVHVKMLEHSFSGALSYAQASFPGHMMSSSSVMKMLVVAPMNMLI